MSADIPIALFFPGQGSQHKGMGIDYYTHSPRAREIFDTADRLAGQLGLGYSVTRFCFEDPGEELKGLNINTAKVQPALLTVGIAIYEHLLGMGLKPPIFMAGHSAGKIIAAAAASRDFDTGFEMMVRRGEEMKNSRGMRDGVVGIIDTTGKEVPGIDPELGLLGLVQEALKELGPLASSFSPSVENTLNQVMFSGLKAQLTPVLDRLGRIPHRLLDIYEGAPVSHSPLVADAQQGFNNFVEGLRGKMNKLSIPLIDDRNGLVITAAGEYLDSLKDHISGPISWRKVMRAAVEGGVDVGFEVGPGRVLKGISTRGTGMEVYTTGTLKEVEIAKHRNPYAFSA